MDSDGISAADENDGNSEEDGFESLTLVARGGLNLPADSRLEADLRYVDSDKDSDSFVFPDGLQDGNESTESEALSGNLRYTGELFDGRLTNDIQLGFAEIERNGQLFEVLPLRPRSCDHQHWFELVDLAKQCHRVQQVIVRLGLAEPADRDQD